MAKYIILNDIFADEFLGQSLSISCGQLGTAEYSEATSPLNIFAAFGGQSLHIS